MFGDSLLENHSTEGARRRWTALLSFTLQIAAACVCVALPLIYPETLPVLHAYSCPQILPPPGGPPPATRTHTRPSHTRNVGEDSQVIHAPSQVPPHINMNPELSRRAEAHDGPAVPWSIGDNHRNERNLVADLLSGPSFRPMLKTTSPSTAVPLTSRVSLGLLIARVEPRYPPLAIQARIQGDVMLAAIIDRNGRIENLHVLSGPPMLTQAALDAVRQWRYRPYLLNDEAVEVETQVVVRFRLNN